MAASFDVKNLSFAELKSRHVFLRDLDPEERRAAIAKATTNDRLRASAWKFPGKAADPTKSFDENIAAAGVDFEVRESIVLNDVGQPIKGYKALTRTDNQRPISVVGEDYGVVQARETLGGLKGICDAGHAILANAWAKDDGRQFGAAALIGNSAIASRIGGDKPEVFAHYIVAKSGHDGATSLVFERYTDQLICFNGATTSTKAETIRLRHSSRVLDRVQLAHGALAQLIADAVEEQALFERLAQDRLSLEQFIGFADELLGGIADDATDRSKTIYQNKVVELTGLFQSGVGNNGASKLDAYSALTEWLTPRRDAYKDAAKYAAKFYNDTAAGARPAKLRERAVRLLTR